MTPETALSARLKDDITWRIRELSEIIRLCADQKVLRQEAALRASVPVLYAHWEGYFVVAVNAYLSFIATKRIKMSNLKDEFWVLAVRKRARPTQLNSDRRLSDFLLDLRQETDKTFKPGVYDKIHASSNLKSDVLEFCCKAVGIKFSAYSSYIDFINRNLVEKRNHIAHGSSLRARPKIELSDFSGL